MLKAGAHLDMKTCRNVQGVTFSHAKSCLVNEALQSIIVFYFYFILIVCVFNCYIKI